jgi:hypothetical protein
MKLPLRLACSLGFLVTSLVTEAADLAITENAETIVVSYAAEPILTYHKATMPSPAGESDLYQKSGFIHPLHAPGGGVVTSIHAPDHFHHMGLWHAWVHTEFRGRPVDFWNVKDNTGFVRFVGSQGLHQAPELVGFTVRQEQVASAHDDVPAEVVLAETFSVSVGRVDGANVIDYVIRQRNVTDAPLLFPAYRYGGGIAYRAPINWEEGNAEYLTSEGLDRSEGHATRGRWVAMYGPTESGDATVVIMGHPANHDAPQRMRIWPKGKIFFNYVPAQEFDWKVEAGEEIELSYRVIVLDGRPDAQVIETHWSNYLK